jgi:hypothetical protein
MDPDGVSVFDPSTIQHNISVVNHDEEEAQADAEEAQFISDGVRPAFYKSIVYSCLIVSFF